jgi:hypothetical protein
MVHSPVAEVPIRNISKRYNLPMAESDRAAGASAARHKIARHLRSVGIEIESSDGRPPTDDDFLTAILSYFQTDPVMIRFQRYRDKIGVPIPQSVLDWLRAEPDRRYPVLRTQRITDRPWDRYHGWFYLSWSIEQEDFVLSQTVFAPGRKRPSECFHEFEWDEETN